MSIQERVGSLLDGGSKQRTLEEKEQLLGYALILPSLLLVSLIILYPLAYNIYLSFHEVPLAPGEAPTFVAVEHYADLLSNSAFWEALYNTIIFRFVSDILAHAEQGVLADYRDAAPTVNDLKQALDEMEGGGEPVAEEASSE
jgi:multiple sugar transport system permease protein